MTFAARDFSPRRGVSDEHIPQWICKERATKSGRKRPVALRVAPNLACGFVARRLQPPGGDAPSSRLAKHQTPNSNEAPSPKLQTPERLQVPSSKRGPRFGAWNLGFIWCLELGFWCFDSGFSLELGVWCLVFRSAAR